ncbi:gag-pol polyprotein, partial [Tanacetum coccineum]
ALRKLDAHDISDCSGCKLSKFSALPFSNSVYSSNAPFDLVHSDVWGPSPVSTKGCSRSFLVSADVPSVFWGEAVLTATYVINRTPTTHNSGLSPFEKLYGTLPDCSSLRLEARLRNLEGRELNLSDGSTKGKPKIEFYNKDQKTGCGAMITPAKVQTLPCV